MWVRISRLRTNQLPLVVEGAVGEQSTRHAAAPRNRISTSLGLNQPHFEGNGTALRGKSDRT